MKNKAQVTIFIIIAIVIVAAVAAYFVFRGSTTGGVKIPTSIEPIYANFLSCLEDDTLVGIDILETQAGYISLPDFEPGSRYMPFSSQLNFLGNPIPYWYYVSGNNIQKEQIPSLSSMEKELGNFIEEKINKCVFEDYYEQGFEINYDGAKADVSINDNEVEVNLDMNLGISRGEDTALIKSHQIIIKSKLGRLYKDAINIYEQEQDTLFLENYAVDTLRLYAPVDGVELTCSPLTWNAEEVFSELQDAIEANTLALKTKNSDYVLNNKENEYFVIDIETDSGVRFINSKNWANSFEVNPSEGVVLISKPVGSQPGLGILGFCYVPYHYVYNVNYPVLVQVYASSGGVEETFQFPVAVVVQGNKPRKALDVSAVGTELPELCDNKNTIMTVNVYDSHLRPVDADISYECFGTNCEIGKTESGEITAEFPQCANGFVRARAEGYDDAKYLYSTTQEGSVDIVLDKLYELNVDLKLDSKSYNEEAIISFISDKNSKTIIYPGQKKVKLSEGQYEIQVYVYKNSTIKLQETTYEQCIEVPKSGVGALFGLTEEQCFDVNIPAQIISNALSGGGRENYYILESELQSSSVVEINARGLPSPKSIEDLQNNYILFEDKDLGINFK